MTPEEYLEKLLDRLEPQPLPDKTLPLDQLLDRVLAEDIYARFAVPPFTNSAMDGFAVHSTDFQGEGPWTFKVSTDIPAASISSEGELATSAQPGTAARIMTGAPMPQWANCVVKVEDTDAPAGASDLRAQVSIHRLPTPGLNVRMLGEDVPAGALVIPKGTVLGPHDLSSLVSVGYAQAAVSRKPRVAILATGTELVPAGVDLKPGQIPDSNSLLLASLVSKSGGKPSFVASVADTPEDFENALKAAAANADLIVSTGGVSMGAFDPVKEYGLSHGWTFSKVSMQPGKPQGFGRFALDNRSVGVIALPGNPVSVALSFTLFVKPVLKRMLGMTQTEQQFYARAGDSWKSHEGRRQYVPVVIKTEGQNVTAHPTHRLGSGSHLVASLHLAQAYAVVDAATTQVNTGDVLPVISL
ncbi:MAG: molybdopterin molybdotransferase MoeA [Actinomycetaceae bacterium]|nr:molybdopterin molybdotransferase MoeA [Actinomycetaceae bacterium]